MLGVGPPAIELPLPPDPFELALHWDAPPQCPDVARIEARIAALLPGDPAGEGVLDVHGTVVAIAGGFELTLRSTYRDATELRRLESTHCDDLAEATALVLAAALTPGFEPPTEPGSASDPVELPAVSPSKSTPEPGPVQYPDDTFGATSRVESSPPRRAPRRPSGLALRAAGGIEAGAIPAPAALASIALALLWRRARVELTATFLPPRARAHRGPASYMLATAGARSCMRWFVRALELPTCVGIEAGFVQARGFSRSTRGPWLAPLASFGLARGWDRVAVWSSAELAVRTVWTQFHRETLAFSPFPVSFRALVGIEVRLYWNRGAAGH